MPTQSQSQRGIASLLESQTLGIVHGINTRTLDALDKYASPDFQDTHELCPGNKVTHGVYSHVDCMEKLYREYPEFTATPLGAVVHVTEHLGQGTVWMTLIISGKPPGILKEIVVQFHWKRRDSGEWRCAWIKDITTVPPMPC